MQFKDKYWYIVIALALIGFFLRIYSLSYQSFWIDEVFSVNAAKGILEHGYPFLESGVVYARDVLHTYLLAFSNDITLSLSGISLLFPTKAMTRFSFLTNSSNSFYQYETLSYDVLSSIE